MKHKKIIYLIVGLVLMIGLTTGGILAWLTDTKEITPITLTVGKVEYTWVPGTLKSNPVVPGDNIVTAPYKLTNSSTVTSELRLKIEVLDGQTVVTNVFGFTLATNWVLDSQTGIYYYRAGSAVQGKYPIAVATTSIDVLSGITLDGSVIGNAYQGKSYTVKITFEAKQNDHVAWSDLGSVSFSTGLANG